MRHHQSTSNIENKIFFSKFKPDKKIGEGSFGKIYSAHNINTGEKYALKLEARNISQPLLDQEAQILCYLKGGGIPFIKTSPLFVRQRSRSNRYGTGGFCTSRQHTSQHHNHHQ